MILFRFQIFSTNFNYCFKDFNDFITVVITLNLFLYWDIYN